MKRADDSHWRAPDGSRFFPISPSCPYCREKIGLAYSNARVLEENEDLSGWWRDDLSVQVRACDRCGWWHVEDRTDHENNDSDDFRWYYTKYRRAVLEVHNLASRSIPIDALASELKKHPDDICQIHH